MSRQVRSAYLVSPQVLRHLDLLQGLGLSGRYSAVSWMDPGAKLLKGCSGPAEPVLRRIGAFARLTEHPLFLPLTQASLSVGRWATSRRRQGTEPKAHGDLESPSRSNHASTMKNGRYHFKDKIMLRIHRFAKQKSRSRCKRSERAMRSRQVARDRSQLSAPFWGS